jgi:hypothetical protein
MAREELKWQNIDADDLPAEVKKSEERRPHARGQVPTHEPEGQASGGRVCELATR